MPEFTQGICADGAAILKNGQPMTPEQIITELRGVNYSMETPKMIVFDRETGKEISDEDELMKMAKLHAGMGFEDIGIQRDGTPVVFDKCGNFGYLDINKVRITLDLF